MKKNIIKFVLLFIAISLLYECYSWLDVDPADKYSADTFWKTEEHASAGLTGCYKVLHPWRNNYTFEFDMITSNAMPYNEANGVDESVYNAINQVRKRSKVDMPEIPKGLTKEQMREAIRLERRIELALEGLYYYDVLRWKTIETENNGAMHNANGVEIVIRKFNPVRDYLWPIPYNQTVQNPNLEQNPNWD